MDMVVPNNFYSVNVSTYEEKGVSKGAVVYSALIKALPVEENDPYLQRIYVGVHLTNNFSVIVPDVYIMDPRELTLLDPETTKIYFNQLEIDYEGKNAE